MSALQPTTPSPTRRSPLVLAGAALVCGLGLAAVGVTLVRAADQVGMFEVFRNDYVDRAVRSVRLKERATPPSRAARGPSEYGPIADLRYAPPSFTEVYASESAPPRKPVRRKARVEMTSLGATISARRTLCVRTCDGFTFPLGTVASTSDLPAHKAACAAACPGAETALYTLSPGQKTEDTAAARSVADGTPYRRLSTAFLFRKALVPTCSCQGPDNIAKRLPILLDPTLRSGDVFVDTKGTAKVYAGRGQVPHSPRAFADFRGSPALNKQARAQVDRVMGVSQREARARAYERTLAFREAALAQRAGRGFEPVARIRTAQLREVSAPAGSAAFVRVYQATNDGGRVHPSGARIIEIR